MTNQIPFPNITFEVNEWVIMFELTEHEDTGVRDASSIFWKAKIHSFSSYGNSNSYVKSSGYIFKEFKFDKS